MPAIHCSEASCPTDVLIANQPYPTVVLLLALILVIDGGLGVWGASIAYLVGTVLSALVLILMIFIAVVTLDYTPFSAFVDAAAGAALAAAAILTSVLARRKRRELSEQANPLNLPVFG